MRRLSTSASKVAAGPLVQREVGPEDWSIRAATWAGSSWAQPVHGVAANHRDPSATSPHRRHASSRGPWAAACGNHFLPAKRLCSRSAVGGAQLPGGVEGGGAPATVLRRTAIARSATVVARYGARRMAGTPGGCLPNPAVVCPQSGKLRQCQHGLNTAKGNGTCLDDGPR